MIYSDQSKLSKRIIEHLMLRAEMKDDLEGIAIGIYDREIKELSMEIDRSLKNLINKGIIVLSNVTKDGKQYYQLLETPKQINS